MAAAASDADRRWMRVALTLADLAGEPHPGRSQLLEAIGYRQLDRLRSGRDRPATASSP